MKTGISKYKINEQTLLNEDHNSFYLLGAFMSDGHVNTLKHHKCFGISSKDKDWLESIRNILCPTKPIYDKNNHYVLETSNEACSNWLISYGCTPKKSLIIRLVKNIPQPYHPDFIRGLIDGDGSISKCTYIKKDKSYNKLTTYICSASKDFLEDIKTMIPLSIKCNVVKVKQNNSFINEKEVIAKSDMFRIMFNDSNAKKLLAWAYYTNNNLSLKRKQTIVDSIMAPQV